MAEAHPVGFRWAMKARERGAKLIHVDPHYSRTSAVSDLYAQIRAGSDIAFLGGLIRHIIETDSYFKEYVVNYTNAAHDRREDFEDTEDLEGYFSGYDPETGHLRPRVLDVRGRRGAAAAGEREHATQAFSEKTGAGMHDRHGLQRRDAPAPALRLPAAQEALRALHAGDGRARLRHPARDVPRGRRDADRQLGPRAHHRARLRRRAGRSTPRACR